MEGGGARLGTGTEALLLSRADLLSGSQEEDFLSMSQEDLLLGSQEDLLSVLQEDSLFVSKEDFLSVSQEDLLTESQEDLLLVSQEAPLLPWSRYLWMATTVWMLSCSSCRDSWSSWQSSCCASIPKHREVSIDS